MKIIIPIILALCIFSTNVLSDWCYDNNTKAYNVSIALNSTTWYNLTNYEICANGCDNVTSSCNPDLATQNLIALGLFIMLALSGFIIYKVFK